MKFMKSSILLMAGVLLILSSITASAESDPTGDVYRYNGYDAGVLWEPYGTKAHIDVTDASFSISGSDITVSLTVSDSISNDQTYEYYFNLKTSPTSYYNFDYTYDDAIATGNGELAGYIDTNPDYLISPDGKTITYTFTDVDTSLDYSIEAYAVEFEEYGNTIGPAWYDYVPDSEAGYYAGGNNGNAGSGSTPGFEIIVLFTALVATLFIVKFRKY